MANKIANRVKMTVSGAPGTGPITLGSAVTGFQSFTSAGVSNNDTVPYVLEDGTSWEIGVGTYTASGTSLSRTSITASSNSGSAISATAGAIVMISPLAADLQAGTSAGNLVQLDGSAKLPAVDGSALTALNGSNISTGTIAAARIDTGTTANKIIALDSSGKYPAADGSLITSLNGSNISSGTINSARLPSISLSSGVTGTLPVANGGTGLTSLTAGYIPFGNGTGAFSASSNFQITSGYLYLNNSGPTFIVDGASGVYGRYKYNGTNVGIIGTANQVISGGGTTDFALGTETSSSLIFSTNNTEKMRITSDGLLGVGTTPTYIIDAYSPASVASSLCRVRVKGTTNYAVFQAENTGGILWAGLETSTGGSIFSGTAAYSGVIGTNGAYPLAFATNGAERARIDSSGRLGINETSPQKYLSITQNISTNYSSPDAVPVQVYVRGYGGSSKEYAGIGFSMAEVTNGYIGASIHAYDDSSSYGAALTFKTSTGSGTPTPTEKMRLTSGGNLLVGTTTSGGGKICVKNTPTSQWGIDFNECEVAIANGANAALPTGSGMVILTDPTQSGATGVYILGAASVVRVDATGTFVAPTTSPGAGTASIQFASGAYRIYNNIGTTITFKVAMLRTRNEN